MNLILGRSETLEERAGFHGCIITVFHYLLKFFQQVEVFFHLKKIKLNEFV